MTREAKGMQKRLGGARSIIYRAVEGNWMDMKGTSCEGDVLHGCEYSLGKEKNRFA